jgi:hypothetical protein
LKFKFFFGSISGGAVHASTLEVLMKTVLVLVMTENYKRYKISAESDGVMFGLSFIKNLSVISKVIKGR